MDADLQAASVYIYCKYYYLQFSEGRYCILSCLEKAFQFFMLFAGCQIWHEITAVDHSYYPRISYIPRRTRILSLGINTMQIQTWQSRTLCTVLLLTKRKLRQKKKADFSPFCLQNDVPLGCFVIVLRLKEEEKGLLFEEGGP